MLSEVLWAKKITRDTKLRIYKSIIQNTLTYGAENWHLNKNLSLKFCSTEIGFFRRSIRYSKLDKVRNGHQIGNEYSKFLNGLVRYKQLECYGLYAEYQRQDKII